MKQFLKNYQIIALLSALALPMHGVAFKKIIPKFVAAIVSGSAVAGYKAVSDHKSAIDLDKKLNGFSEEKRRQLTPEQWKQLEDECKDTMPLYRYLQQPHLAPTVDKIASMLNSQDRMIVAKQLYDDLIELDNIAESYDKENDLTRMFEKLKNDFNIHHDVQLKNEKGGTSLGGEAASYLFPTRYVLLNHKILDRVPKSGLIYYCAHELEHYRQFHDLNYTHLYGGTQSKIAQAGMLASVAQERAVKQGYPARLERGADIEASNYVKCYKCLKERITFLDSFSPDVRSNPHTNEAGSFTTARGYLSIPEIELYQQRAKNHGWLCEAHKKYGDKAQKEAKYEDFCTFHTEKNKA